MKNILKISIAALLGVMLLASCSKDYMNTIPTSSTATPTIFESTENAALAVNGICKLMTRQYLGSQGFNGEGTIKLYTGEYPGDNLVVNLPGWASVINGTNHDSKISTYNYYNWYYYYMLIGNANAIILNIDNAKGDETEKQFIKAQALSFRAYSYMMLLQVYSVRWGDSSNGASDGVVLRLDTSTDEMPLSTMADCYKQIYDDLDEAIRLYTESGLAPDSKDNYSPNIDIAYANADDLDVIIQNERIKELFLEGHRLFDITRRHEALSRDAACGSSVLSMTFPDDRFILPVPLVELDANKAMQPNPINSTKR